MIPKTSPLLSKRGTTHCVSNMELAQLYKSEAIFVLWSIISFGKLAVYERLMLFVLILT